MCICRVIYPIMYLKPFLSCCPYRELLCGVMFWLGMMLLLFKCMQDVLVL